MIFCRSSQTFFFSPGLEEGSWGRVAPLPEVAAFIENHMTLTREGDFLSSLGAVGPGHEFSIPAMFTDLVAGIRRNTTLTDEDMEYFTLHIVEDQEHAVVFNKLIARHVQDEAGQAALRAGAMRSLALRKSFWDGLMRAVFE